MSDETHSHSHPTGPGPQQPSFQVRVPLEWAEADEVPIVYANQVLVSHGGPEFFIVFGVVLPPTNPAELPDALKIQPQVRVVVSRDAMPSIVNALNVNLGRYRDGTSRTAPEASASGEPTVG